MIFDISRTGESEGVVEYDSYVVQMETYEYTGNFYTELDGLEVSRLQGHDDGNFISFNLTNSTNMYYDTMRYQIIYRKNGELIRASGGRGTSIAAGNKVVLERRISEDDWWDQIECIIISARSGKIGTNIDPQGDSVQYAGNIPETDRCVSLVNSSNCDGELFLEIHNSSDKLLCSDGVDVYLYDEGKLVKRVSSDPFWLIGGGTRYVSVDVSKNINYDKFVMYFDQDSSEFYLFDSSSRKSALGTTASVDGGTYDSLNNCYEYTVEITGPSGVNLCKANIQFVLKKGDQIEYLYEKTIYN